MLLTLLACLDREPVRLVVVDPEVPTWAGPHPEEAPGPVLRFGEEVRALPLYPWQPAGWWELGPGRYLPQGDALTLPLRSLPRQVEEPGLVARARPSEEGAVVERLELGQRVELAELGGRFGHWGLLLREGRPWAFVPEAALGAQEQGGQAWVVTVAQAQLWQRHPLLAPAQATLSLGQRVQGEPLADGLVQVGSRYHVDVAQLAALPIPEARLRAGPDGARLRAAPDRGAQVLRRARPGEVLQVAELDLAQSPDWLLVLEDGLPAAFVSRSVVEGAAAGPEQRALALRLALAVDAPRWQEGAPSELVAALRADLSPSPSLPPAWVPTGDQPAWVGILDAQLHSSEGQTGWLPAGARVEILERQGDKARVRAGEGSLGAIEERQPGGISVDIGPIDQLFQGELWLSLSALSVHPIGAAALPEQLVAGLQAGEPPHRLALERLRLLWPSPPPLGWELRRLRDLGQAEALALSPLQLRRLPSPELDSEEEPSELISIEVGGRVYRPRAPLFLATPEALVPLWTGELPAGASLHLQLPPGPWALHPHPREARRLLSEGCPYGDPAPIEVGLCSAPETPIAAQR